MRDTGHSGLTVLLRSSLLAALLVLPSVALAATTATGTVLGPAGVTPVPGAYVNFYNLVTGTTYQSEMTDANGAFLVTGMQEGRYDVAVETDRGLWLVMRPVEFDVGERTLSFALRERTYWEGAGDVPPRSTPLGTNIVGTAVILEEDREEAVVPMGTKKKAGIAAAIGGGVLAIILLSDSGSSGEASPFTP